jgi:hypothetical protein
MTAASAAPTLALMERLAAYAASRRRPSAHRVSLAAVTLGTETIRLDLTVGGLTFLADGRYVVDARIESTDPLETRCSAQLTAGRWAGRLAQTVAGLLPDRWINVVLSEWFPGVRREGRAYVVSHRILAQALLRLRPLS